MVLATALVCACLPPEHLDGPVRVDLHFHGDWTDQEKAQLQRVVSNGMNGLYLEGLSTYGLHPVLAAQAPTSIAVELYAHGGGAIGDPDVCGGHHFWNYFGGHAGAEVDVRCAQGSTAIFYASELLSHEIVEAITDPGAGDDAREVADPCEGDRFIVGVDDLSWPLAKYRSGSACWPTR
jgi:hypothetical protein